MQILTVTSDNYVPHTVLMLQSLRVWHPDLPVTVYALDTGWGPQHAAALAPYRVAVRTLAEGGDTRNRGGAMGGANQAAFKLDAFLDQTGPFLHLDSDALVLKPLDPIFDRVRRDGWFSVHEGTPLRAYLNAEVVAATGLPADLPGRSSLNAGVLGCDPRRYQAVFRLAREWLPRIQHVRSGD